MDKISFSGRVTRCFKNAVLINDYVRVPLVLLPPGSAVTAGDVFQGVAARNSSAEQYTASQIEAGKSAASPADAFMLTTSSNTSNPPAGVPTELYEAIDSDDDDKDTTGRSKMLLKKLLLKEFSAGRHDEVGGCDDENKPLAAIVKTDIVVVPTLLDFGTFPLHEQRRLNVRVTNSSDCLMHTLRSARLLCESRVHKLLISLTSPSRDENVCSDKAAPTETCDMLEKWFSVEAKNRRKKPVLQDKNTNTNDPQASQIRCWNIQLSEADSCYMSVIIDGEFVGELKEAVLQLEFDSCSRDEIVKIPIYACVEIPVKPQQTSKSVSALESRKPKLQFAIPRATPMIKICLSPESMARTKRCFRFGEGLSKAAGKTTGREVRLPSSPLALVPRSFAFREVDKDTRLRELECVVLADETDRISSRPLKQSEVSRNKTGGAGGRTAERQQYDDEEFGRCLVLPTQRMKLKIPTSVLSCIKDPSSWKSHLPALKEPLRAENYKERFQVLLALEMASVDMRWQNLRVDGVHFAKQSASKDGRVCFSFDATVLYSASFNPVAEMQRRDESVYIYARRASHHHNAAIVFEGFADRIAGTVVHGLFDDGFNPQPSDEYTVTFRPRHETLHRMFAAVHFIQAFMNQAFHQILFVPSNGAELLMPPQCIPSKLKCFNSNLNEEQRLAVNRICAGQLRPRPMLIYGPPGTGKTMTVVEAALQVAAHVPESKILLCAPSNAAVGWLMELLEKFLLLNEPKIDVKTLKVLRLLSNSSRRITADTEKPSVATSVVLKLKNLTNILSTIGKHRIVVATCSAMGWFFQLDEARRMFSHVFVDEAASCVEAECVIPLLMLKMPSYGLFRYDQPGGDVQPLANKLVASNTGRYSCLGMASTMPNEGWQSDGGSDSSKTSYLMPQIVLAGDPKQLGAVTHSEDAAAFTEYNKIADPLHQSLMERLMLLPQYQVKSGATLSAIQSHSIVMLKKNYRSAASIVALVSEMFYDGSLTAAAADSLTATTAGDANSLSDGLSRQYAKAVTIITHEKPHAKEANWTSLHNMSEVQAAVEITVRLVTTFGVAPENIGIIATYRSQANAIQLALKLQLKKNCDRSLKLPMIGTVQEFQGQERDVIILSTVRSQTQQTIEKIIGAVFGGKANLVDVQKNSCDAIEYSVSNEAAMLNDADFDKRWIDVLNTIKISHPEFEKSTLGFVADARRFNVAITRARKKLVILGNPYTLALSPFWYRFMLLIEKQQNGEGSGGASFHGDHRMSDVRSFARYLYADVLKSGKVLVGTN